MTIALSPEQVAAALRRWTGKDNHRQAGENLLMAHGFWLGRGDFLSAALNYDHEEDAAIIAWTHAREFLDSGPRAATSELATLDFATALGEDRYRITALGHGMRGLLREALHTATGTQ